MLRNGHDRLSVFGIGKDVPQTTWKGLFRQLTAAGYLTGDDEGMGTLILTERARPLLRGEERFLMRVTRQAAKTSKRAASVRLKSRARKPAAVRCAESACG